MTTPEIVFMGFIGFMFLLAVGKKRFEKHSSEKGYCDLHKMHQ